MQVIALASALAGLAAAAPADLAAGSGDKSGLPAEAPQNWPGNLPWPPGLNDLPIPKLGSPSEPSPTPAANGPAPFVPFVPGFVCDQFDDNFDSYREPAGEVPSLSTTYTPVGETAPGVLRYDGFSYYSQPESLPTWPLNSPYTAIGANDVGGAPYIVGKNATTWFGLSSATIGCGLPFPGVSDSFYPIGCSVRFTGARADNSVVEQTFPVQSVVKPQSITFDQDKFYALRNVSVEVIESMIQAPDAVVVLDDIKYGACFMRS